MWTVSGPTYEINLIKNESFLRRGKNPALLRHIKCCSQLALFLWTSRSTSRWEIINVLIKLVLHVSVGTFLFCKAFSSLAQRGTHKRFFFYTRSVFWLQLEFYDFRKPRVEEVIHEKEYFSLTIFTFCKGVSFVFGFSSPAYQGNEVLAPAGQDLWSNERGREGWCRWQHLLCEYWPSTCKNCWLLHSLCFSLINLLSCSLPLTGKPQHPHMPFPVKNMLPLGQFVID